MPHRDTDDPENVVFNDRNKPFTDYALSEDDMARWAMAIQLRDGVNAALEQARGQKLIGKALEAVVSLVRFQGAPVDNLAVMEQAFSLAELADLFLVSGVAISDNPDWYARGAGTPVEGIRVLVAPSNDAKCERCWKQLPDVGTDPAHPTLCARCAAVVADLV